MLILNYTTCVPTLMAVGMFSLYHFYCMASNTTTIEGWEKDKATTLKRRGKIRSVCPSPSSFLVGADEGTQFKYPYDLGMVKNVQSILGRNPLLWCLPQKMDGDGLSYAVGKGIGTSSVWETTLVADERGEGPSRFVV